MYRKVCLTVKRLVESAASRSQISPSVSVPVELDTDARSPLERFRTKPQKALSVTDIVSPSWCELQYWYTLTKHGRKRRTPAMRQGSAVHKTLEDQVYQTVAVKLDSKEDALGLRIWNVIQGLKTLRETGMTREMEVWGIEDGQVINGVIDELSYICPDRELEEEATARTAHRNQSQTVPSADQASITSFFKAGDGHSSPQGVFKDLRTMRRKTSKVYLTDVKTRGVRSIPKGASFRPTLMQLMLYHLLLSNLATNKVDANAIFKRYDLDPNVRFSDSFVAQIGGLNEAYYDSTPNPFSSQEPQEQLRGSMQLILDNNSLRALWNFMIKEFQRTMPAGVDSFGKVLKAEYRDQLNGDILGVKTFLFDRSVIQGYLDSELSWWRGEREAQGVMIEEAYKCRICEFAEGCTWRKLKIDEATQAHRIKTRSVV